MDQIRLNSKQNCRFVTICILTFNGERYISETLTAIYRQKASFEYETLVIDSGSIDKTLDILHSFPVRLVCIPNSEFGHGKTRNLAVKLAKGDYVVFLVQDATPSSEHWLERIIEPFNDKRVVAVYGKHLARRDAAPFIKFDTEEHFKSIFSGEVPYYQQSKAKEEYSLVEWNLLTFFSDVNSALRKSFVTKHPFKNVRYAEDQAMGESIIKEGLIKVYHPQAAVYHSHSYHIWQYLFRFYDEYRGLRETIGFIDSTNICSLWIQTLKGGLKYAKYITFLDNAICYKIKWIGLAFLFIFFQRLAAYLVRKERFLPIFLKEQLSLEYRLKLQGKSKKQYDKS